MRIGIGLPAAAPGVDGTTIGAWAAEAERAGFASVGVIDRLVYDNLEPLTVLAAAAARTEHVELFTVASVPVMTRLRQPERVVLDTLVDSGVARSRSDALAWAVRLVGQHADEWLGELRAAMAKVDDLRAKGPTGEGS